MCSNTGNSLNFWLRDFLLNWYLQYTCFGKILCRKVLIIPTWSGVRGLHLNKKFPLISGEQEEYQFKSDVFCNEEGKPVTALDFVV